MVRVLVSAEHRIGGPSAAADKRSGGVELARLSRFDQMYAEGADGR